MTRPEPDPPVTGEESPPGGDVDAAEHEEAEDDAERSAQQGRSALIGLVALILVIVLTVVGVWASVSQLSQQPDPGVVQQMPPPPNAP